MPRKEPEEEDEEIEEVELLGTEEEEIRRLDRSGAFNEVVGSQSLLSQELLSEEPLSPIVVKDEEEEEEEGKAGMVFSKDLILTGNLDSLKCLVDRLEQRHGAASSSTNNSNKPRAMEEVQEKKPMPVESSACSSSSTKRCGTRNKKTVSNSDNTFKSKKTSVCTRQSKKRLRPQSALSADESQSSATSASKPIQRQSKKRLRPQSVLSAEESQSSATSASKPIHNPYKRPSAKSTTKPKSSKKLAIKNPYKSQQQQPHNRQSKCSKKTTTPTKEHQESSANEDDDHKKQAKTTATLASQLLTSAKSTTQKEMFLALSLCRKNPRNPKHTNYDGPPPNHTIPAGFYWSHYPPLERILRTHMSTYYELSFHRKQSRQQQDFNNKLVSELKQEASKRGWEFVIEDKSIRDRMRCYYKTLLANAKKRLKTMLKNPEKKMNVESFLKHRDLITAFQKDEQGGEEEVENATQEDTEDALVLHTQCGDSVCDRASPPRECDDIFTDTDEMTHNAAQAVLALGFAKLSQDAEVGSL